MPDIARIVQWKLPATSSHFIQCAGCAVRGHGQIGLAILLVKRSAYNTDLVNEQSMPPPSLPATCGKLRGGKGTSKGKVTAGPKRDNKDTWEYAVTYGVNHSSSKKLSRRLESETSRDFNRRKRVAVEISSGMDCARLPCGKRKRFGRFLVVILVLLLQGSPARPLLGRRTAHEWFS